MTQIANVSEQTKQHCKAHKMCAGCPFVGGECVAPVASYTDQRHHDWIVKMNDLIAGLYGSEGDVE